MTEQLDAEANNLCILEDAFEKFQAVSMYQEEEFIMLPQTEPANPEPPEPDDNNPPPVISEVVVSTCNDVNNSVNSEIYEMEGFESSSCVESSANISGLDLLGQEKGSSIIDSNEKVQLNSNEYNHGNNTDLNVSNIENVNNQDNTSVNSNLVPRRRGRKPKKLSVQTEECSALSVSKHIPNPDISSTPFSSDPEMTEVVPVIRKKRGRPRKVWSHEQNNTVPIISNKDAASELSSSDNNRPDDSIPKKTRGKRGRPKGSGNKLPQTINQVNQEQLPSNESPIKEDIAPVEELAIDNLNKVNEIPKKRKRVSVKSNLAKIDIVDSNIDPDRNKNLNEILGDDDLDDICLSKLRSAPEQSTLNNSGDENGSTDYKSESLLNVSKDVSSEDIEGQPTKVKKRRGRPKRIMAISQFVEQLEPVADHEDLSEGSLIKVDNADDVCLSEFKSMSGGTAPAETEPEMPGNEVHLSGVQQPEGEVSDLPNSDINVLEVPNNEMKVSDMDQHNSECDDTPTKRNTKMPIMADFEYNIDSVLEKENADIGADNSLLVEDTSKRPIRRKVKKFKYQEESDEDPFANVELSDDEPRRGRRGNKYYSDDEYIPGKRGNDTIVTSTDTEVSDSELNIKIDDNKKQRRRKLRKKSDNQSPRKRGKKDDDQMPTILNMNDVTSLDQNQESHTNDIEICLEPSVIKASDGETQPSQPSQQWGTTTEFENFLAKKIQGTNLKIKKVSSNVPAESNKMDIPIIDPEAKKSIEMCTQTSVVPTTSKAVQTVTPYDIPMKENIALTPEQSEKACYFLNGIVKTTAELGILMTQKSEDFIKKKINTSHVTDTSKMDYCVKKSFLLFKLAKHNLLQMEEDLAKQYNQFLEANNLTRCREEQKEVVPSTKEANSDSDCEIVDVKPSLPIKPQQKTPVKPAFNPKTVFLNKELSIKIAKKPSDSKKIDIQGRHTVWINDTVMVKKVKPTQSFLAQDSRNKKPPDNIITTEMVSNFFKDYNRERVLSTCAPFVSTDWLTSNAECICNYFVVQPPQYKNNNSNYSDNGFNISSTGSTMPEPNLNLTDKGTAVSSPESLFTLCFHKLKNQLFCKEMNHFEEITYETRHDLTDVKKVPVSLFRLCLKAINDITTNNKMAICPISSTLEVLTNDTITESFSTYSTLPLKSLCHRRIVELLEDTSDNNIETKKEFCVDITYSLEETNDNLPSNVKEVELQTKKNENGIRSLLSLCVEHIQRDQHIVLTMKNKYSSLEETNDCLPSNVKEMEPQTKKNENGIKSLLSLCVEHIQRDQHIVLTMKNKYSSLDETNDYLPSNVKEMELQTKKNKNGIKSLLSLCVEHIQRDQNIVLTQKNKYSSLEETNNYLLSNVKEMELQTKKNENRIKSLFSLCVEYIQRIQLTSERDNNIILTPLPLKKVALESVKHVLYKSKEPETEGLMIDCVNTLSEEAFFNLEQCNTDIPDSSEYLDDFDNEDNFEPDLTEPECDQTVPSWASQVQMHELRSCVNVNNTDLNEHQIMTPIITQIKLEPLDDESDNLLNSVAVKIEPVPGPDEMTIIPDVKPELDEHVTAAPIQRQNSNSYDENAFEQFVSSNKLMRSITEENTEEIYSQSSERVRRQHEPDYYAESNPDMLGLLVPHTYTPVSIQTAKGSLMESSSDESNKNAKSAPKKVVKRSRGRPKKSEPKSNNKDTPTITPVIVPTPTPSSNTSAPTKEKEKQKGLSSEVAVLTRKMKERIRQEEKNNESTDSENESVTVRLRSRDKKDTSDQTIDKTMPSSKSKTNEIQCSNVDSTDQIDESLGTFTGFTSIETNEMSNYEKYMKFVYNKVIPEHEVQKNEEPNASRLASKNNIEDTKQLDSDDTPLIELNEPVELLECEPTLPIFDKNFFAKTKKEIKSKIKATVSDKVDATAKAGLPFAASSSIDTNSTAVDIPRVTNPNFIDRHGWQCYPVDSRDSKLYSNACIYLEKLPESFVQTYFAYQNIAIKDKSDEEINRLTNLNNLNRATNLKDRRPQSSSKRDCKDDKTVHFSEDDSRTASAVDSDHFDELMPSDDEAPRVEDEVPPPIIRQTDNTLAKNLLMNDNESDEDEGVRVKQEPVEGSGHIGKTRQSSKKNVAHKSEEPASDLMLTADKMMNKELTLLHAPVVMDQKVTLAKGPVTRQNKKSGTKPSPPNNKVKGDEDSSSEEEKQWVSTKEKLLKRLGKKESASADDAKRAKLVSEFIERREGNPDSRKRGLRARRSGKKFLERQKQLRVLQRELFGETSIDPVTKKSSTAWKGRRNIRKVLDKKSLARSTVIANMEEFERKRRLNARQTKLRELLGCEEGVNVLVINDEVCLEYDFEEHRPVVTIHPFFTKVMKAHQYEGVKFMWDACFESLADIEAGHAGGGCILAHCMGLGKTLQVLALLHTVLTHPRVGMQRVLVCCPLSTVLNWVDEIHKWIGPVTNQIKVFELSKLKKTYERAYQLEDWYNGGGIFIIGYELFRSLSTLDPELDDVRPTIVNKIRTALLDPGPDIIVCDEGHLLKNDCSVLAVSMSRVATKRRIVLTGTPMQNNLREYYCMVNFVKPNLLGTYSEYSNRFENPIMNGQHRDSLEEDIKLMKARTHILHKVLEGCLQRQEVSVLYPYLPKKHEYTVFITLTKCQWDLYKHYLNHYSKQRQSKQNSILKDFHILQKIWSHPQVLHNFQTKAQDAKNKVKLEKLEDDLAREDHSEIKEDITTDLWWLQYLEGGDMLNSLEVSNKFVVVFRILDECVALGDKILIFSTSLFCLDALEYFLKKINNWSLGQEYYRLDGSVPAEVRQKWCREFNAENNVNTKVFLVSTRAGCLGLNMTAANRVIIMDTSWNPAHDIQSIFRVYRFGQKKDCFIYRLVALGTMEQKIYERSVTKQAVACRVVDEQQIDRHYNMAELTELYRYDEAGVSVECGVAVGVSDVALLRVARDTALHAVHEHDSLLRSSEQGLPEHERAAAWMQFQQEQAHKQMENKLITNIPKISLKRLEGNNYSQSFELNDFKIKTDEIPKEESAEEFVPKPVVKNKRGRPPGKNVIKPAGPSGRPVGRGKPPKITKQIDREEPGPSTELRRDPDVLQTDEEMMVHKITEILIKHNFQSQDGNTNITNLVTKVRNIFNQGFLFNDDSDELTSSIAKVLLAKKMTIPTLTGIMCDSINNSHRPGDLAEEPELILGNANSETVETVADTRRRRNAALAAEKPGRSGIVKEEPELILNTTATESAVAVSNSRRKRKAAVAAVKRSGSPGIYDEEPELILSTDNSERPLTVTGIRRKRKAAIAAEERSGSPGIYNEEPELILSTDNSERPLTVTGNRRKRKAAIAAEKLSGSPGIYHEEPELILSTDNSERPLTVTDNRRKRKDAIAAEKHIDSISQDVIINLDDELDTTDTDFIPEIIEEPEISQLSKRKYSLRESTPKKTDEDESISTSDTYTKEPESILGKTDTEKPVTKPKSRPKAGPKTYKEKLKQKSEEAKTNEVMHTSEERSNSILLSDEDEIFMDTAESNATTRDNASSTPEDTEVLPLPLALLTNQNFINIVAHTYLNGNPMLDADAATLAAQYSTYKSLKEAEQTGKDITSGPIYDIAVQVIGKEIFRRMNNASATANRLSVEEANVTNELKEKMQEMSGRKSIEVKKEKSRIKMMESSGSQNSSWLETNSSQPMASQYPNGNVVPVGLIKTAGGIQTDEFASSECILPDDDDDLRIVPHDLPALPQLHPAPGYPPRAASLLPNRTSPTPPPNIVPANPAPIGLNNLFATQKKSNMKLAHVIKINKGKIFMPATVTSGKAIIATAPPLAPSDDTICLDSDEEETITPALVTPALHLPQANLAPVPVSFKVEHPSEILSSSSSITPIISAQETPQKTSLVLRQIGAPGAQKFVLVSAGKIVTSKLASSTTPPKLSSSLIAPKLPSSITAPKLFGSLTAPVVSNSATAPKLSSTITSPKTVSSITTPKSSSSIITPKLSSSTTPSNSSNTITTTKLLRKIAPKDIVATQDMQKMLETINAENSKLSTKAPSATYLNKLKQARCKPGDIIKITETGDIEVVPVDKLKALQAPTKHTPSDVKPKPSLSKGTSSSIDAGKTNSSQSGVAKQKSYVNNVPKTKSSLSDVAKSKSSLSDVGKTKSSLSDMSKTKLLTKDFSTVIKQNIATYQAKKNNAIPDTPKQVANPDTPKKVANPDTPKKVANQTTKPRSLSISSSSSESRPASPVDDNPLSILKNVVHIQAADDAPSTSNVQKTNAIRSQKSGDSSVYVHRSYASESKVSTKAAAVKIPTAQNQDSKAKILPKSKDVGKPISSKPSSSLNKIPANKMSGNLPFNKSDKKLPPSSSGSKTVVSKSNTSNNKTFHTVDLTQIPKVTVGSGASILMTKIEAKKRVSTGETSTPKKKKSELTLEDFSLDDIDDIIELD